MKFVRFHSLWTSTFVYYLVFLFADYVCSSRFAMQELNLYPDLIFSDIGLNSSLLLHDVEAMMSNMSAISFWSRMSSFIIRWLYLILRMNRNVGTESQVQ